MEIRGKRPDPHLVAGGLLHELLVAALHGDVPHIVPDVLRLHPHIHTEQNQQRASARSRIRIERERGGEGTSAYPAVRGLVDEILGVAHDAEHAADDSQRQNGLEPVQPRHRVSRTMSSGGDGGRRRR
jgi:hypothetical protein